MHRWAGVIRISFRAYQVFRADLLVRILSGLVAMALQVFVWRAIYASRSQLAGVSAAQAVAYVAIAQVIMRSVSVRSGFLLLRRFRSGELVKDLCLPVNLQGYLLALDVGSSLGALLLVSTPLFIVGLAVFRFMVPLSPVTWLLFVVSWGLGIFVQAMLGFIFACLGMWTEYGWGVEKLKDALVLFFSGALLPLDFFPAGLERVAQVLPFQAAHYIPLSVYVGLIGPSEALPALFLQLGWCVALSIVSTIAWMAVRRRVNFFGG